jgi:hypothetical protein
MTAGSTAGGSGHAQRPNPDVYGFYIPWHQFSPAIRGIYPKIEGIEGLGRKIRARASILSQVYARRVAKLFICHHEAYRNAVETFAAGLEATDRKSCQSAA